MRGYADMSLTSAIDRPSIWRSCSLDRLARATTRADQALKHTAALLQTAVCGADRVGRFGGEEFVVLPPGVDLAEAAERAEALRARLAAQPVQRERPWVAP